MRAARRSSSTFAASFPNIMQYLQTLFSFFNAPLFATFIVGMFWKRMTATAGWVGLVSGTVSAVVIAYLSEDAFGSLSQGVIPIAGQGANNAAHCAGIYTQAILDRGDKPFDPEWMQDTFETFWENRAQWSTALTDALLNPYPEHVQQVLGAAGQYQEVANRFCHLFADPSDIGPFLGDPEQALAFVARAAARAGGS